MTLEWTFLPENEAEQCDNEIRALLAAVFPWHAEFFAHASYRGSIPEFRLLGRDRNGQLLAHLECGRREALADGKPVQILGVGAVAVHPHAQGNGLGKEMFRALSQFAMQNELADFGLLECREAVAEFYLRAGFVRTQQPCTSRHHETGAWDTYTGPVMVLPLRKPLADWPGGGDINLCGLSW